MKELFKMLKPFWKWLVVVILLQMGRAYTSLKLPEYTSSLVDVGIQNSGFEYAVPVEITSEAYQNIESFMNEDEASLWQTSYSKNSSGNYELKENLANSDKELSSLSDQFKTPLALYNVTQDLDQAGQDQIQSQPMTPDYRVQLEEEYLSTDESHIKNLAINQVIDEYEAAGQDKTSVQKSYLKSRAWRMILTALGTLVQSIIIFYLASHIASGVTHKMRMDIYEKVMDFSQAEVKDFSTPSLITRITNDTQQIQMVLAFTIRAILFAPALAVGAIIKVLTTQSKLSWLIFVAVMIIIAMLLLIFKLTIPKFTVIQDQFDDVNQVSREILTGLQVIRAFGRQDYETKRFDKANKSLQGNQLFTSHVTSLIQPFIMLTANSLSICIVYFGSKLIGSGSMEIGEMMAMITYAMQVVFSFLQFALVSMMLPRAIVSLNRINEVVDTDSSIKDKDQPEIIDQPQGLVEFENVSFSFPDAEEATLEDISFTAKPGQTTALIGSTGSGKSTVLELLMRFYDVTDGSVKIDGVDIRDLAQEQVHEMIGYVPQEATLFTGTIQSNIAYGVDELSQDDLQTASEIAHASEFIEEEPYGYQTRVAQGGANFSGGQKQRISIARAIAKKPQIYVFDDSFSALDYQTDASVRKALSEKVSEANVIIVAQRVSTVLSADQIIVMDQGKIESVGTHLELMEKSKIYQEIAHSQLSQKELDDYAEQIKNQEGKVE